MHKEQILCSQCTVQFLFTFAIFLISFGSLHLTEKEVASVCLLTFWTSHSCVFCWVSSVKSFLKKAASDDDNSLQSRSF